MRKAVAFGGCSTMSEVGTKRSKVWKMALATMVSRTTLTELDKVVKSQ
jgi:hypothetical protein